jgi:NhaA family Na+:H+ antiporter
MPQPRRSQITFRRFLESETSGGLVLMAFAALGMAAANSALSGDYSDLFHTPVLGLDLLHWINDGLMAIFFLLVGLEIKREMLEGQLDTWGRRALPLIGAFGGMLVPALFFMVVNAEHQANWRGWAIPTATDIAFALGVLALLGSRVPKSLKVFLTSLAIIDDLGAILIIAIFYAADLSFPALGAAALMGVGLYAMNRLGVRHVLPYLVLGVLLWASMLSSGIHASLAGVILAMAIPLAASKPDDEHSSLLHRMERGLSPWVAFLVLPVFGFANAGVSLADTGQQSLMSPLSIGIIGGLLIGKQLGILLFVFLANRLGFANLPSGASWWQIYGVAILCGIGFTMSLFIGLLAFDDAEREAVVKLSVLVGSLMSALVGTAVLLLTTTRARAAEKPF